MRRTYAATVLSTSVLALAATVTIAQDKPAPIKPPQQGSFTRPVQTEDGVWDGTWVYLSRDARVAVWIRSGRKPEVRLRYQSKLDTESFETDWASQASYTVRGRPAEFRFDIKEADANMMRGDWTWSVEGDDGRKETARVSVYRTGDGRRLAIVFDDYLKILRVNDREIHITPTHAWTFIMASKRLVSWGELPF